MTTPQTITTNREEPVGLSDYPCRISNSDGPRWHIGEDYCPSANSGVITNRYVAEDH